MKAYQILAGASPLQLLDLPDPQPGPGEVLVGMRANSLNYRDLMVLNGHYGALNLPMTPLSDGSGEIVAVGPGVTQWKVGDRVAGTFFQNWLSGQFDERTGESALGGALPGLLAELVVLPETGLVAIPDSLSFQQAATLPCAALTAWHSLVSLGHLSANQTVLLLGTGGVSIFALQFALMHGARVIITSSSDDKLARARALGAHETINYRTTPDWEKEVYRLTGGRGADHVVEVGGLGTFAKSLRALAYGGTISVIGGVSGFSAEVPLIDIIRKMALVHGIYVGSRSMFLDMNRAIDRHRLLPVIDKVFPFTEAPAAFAHLQSGSHFGKVVISH